MIKDLPVEDKPREKAKTIGIENLTDAELIAILLRTGNKYNSALELAQKIINEVGSIANFNNYSLEKLNSICGLGIAKSLSILSALEIGKRFLKENKEQVKIKNSQDIYNNYRYYFYKSSQEMFMVLFLNSKNIVSSFKIIYKGNNNSLNIESSEIFKEALIHCCNKIVLIHNHPSGSLYPSKEDLLTTKKLLESGKLLNIIVLDHIIITDKSYYSFLDNGDMK